MSTQINVNPFFTPTQISGCQLWLDAADVNTLSLRGTTVTQWRDKSGNGRNTTQVTGTVTYSNSGLSITTADSYLTGSFGGSDYTGTTLTCFIVASMNSASGSVGRLLSLGKVGTQDWNNLASFEAFGRGGGLVLRNYRNSLTPASAPSIPAYATPFLATSGQTSTLMFISVNGGTLSTQAISGAFAINAYRIGADLFFEDASEQFNGILNEIVVYFSELSVIQTQQLEGYLAWKWNLQANLPSTHPYKSSPITPLLNPSLTLPIVLQSSFFTPTQIPECSLWLDAADSRTFTLTGTSVTQWRDKSGNNNNTSAVTGTPQYQGNGVYFNGSTAMFGPISNTTNVMSSFLVGTVNNLTALDGRILSFSVQGQADFQANTRVIPFFRLGTSAAISTYRNPSNASAVAISYDTSFQAGTFFNGTNCLFFINGSQGGAIASSSGNFSYSRYGLAQDAGGVDGQRLVGFIYEVISFNASLTTAQRQQVEGYLAWKWGLQGSLPSNHPYKTSPISPLVNPPTQLPVVVSSVWLPTKISGCQVWLDASDRTTLSFSGNNVTQWRNKTGVGNTYNNNGTITYANNSVYFPGSSDMTNTSPVNFSTGTTPSMSTFIVFSYVNVTAARGLFQYGQVSCLKTGYVLYVDVDNKVYGTLYCGVLSVNNSVSANVPYILSDVVTYTGTSGSLRREGWLNGSPMSVTNASTTGVNLNLNSISTLGNAAGQPFLGYISEVLYYNQSLSTTQRQNVEGYLAWKWGRQGSLPANHPFKNWPPSP